MEKINTLTYGPFSTEVLLTPEVSEFFQGNGELTNLTPENSDEWYQKWLLRHLDKDKDGIPDEEFGKEFQLIYTNIIQNPEDYQDTEDILKQFNVPPTNIIFDGSRTIFKDIKDDPQKMKFWVRWIVVKK